ncbi:uncharacterized protein LOC131997227 [Stomoxys calcitrans]|uniref:uncharacterized protein LOC131997227 n=1 Tax=Stomoxys calcitrans TaxID=35570 RepID=UPI0027E26525|nr:uncharacterized protein LOC131997227 [Stomoxys calcitrans]XP_059223808.1 uncharacterized protein LOC131997227 [Stomoxys calcitrans]
MFQNTIKQVIDKTAQITAEVPLSSMANCQFKNDNTKKNKHFKNHKNKADNYWSEFLKAQEKSTANYVYKIEINGPKKDPTLAKEETNPKHLIYQYMRYPPHMKNWSKDDSFHLLCFVLKSEKLGYLIEKKLFQHPGYSDYVILTHIKTTIQNVLSGGTNQSFENFIPLINHAMYRGKDIYNSRHYFEPKRLFMKPPQDELDPYELAYFRNIMENHEKKQLSVQQFLYMLKFVEILKAMPEEQRKQFLKRFHEENALPSACFLQLEHYLRRKAIKCNGQKIKIKGNHFEVLIDLLPCFCKHIDGNEKTK